MKAIGSVIGAPLKALGLVPKIPKPPPPTSPVTMDDATTAALAEQDTLLARKGGAANIVTGASGAEAGTTGKTKLG